MNNTKLRHQQILAAAATAIQTAGGVKAIDGLPQTERLAALRDLYRQVVSATGCHPDTAKRNVAKALRRTRYGAMRARWGGQRLGAGRPPVDNVVRIETETNRPRCPAHGPQDTEYRAQTAPCGCAWVWENGRLIATPGRE
jgi:hypothetical protein